MKTHVLFILLLPALMVSCGKNDPVSSITDMPERVLLDIKDPIRIFTGDDDAVDADVATILNGPGTGDDVDTPWEDGDDNSWAVAVGVHWVDVDNQTILYRFLCEDGLDPDHPVGTVDTDEGLIRLPRVAACYFPDGDPDPFVEVVVAYQFREDDGDDWDIRVQRLEFDPADFTSISTIDPVSDDPLFVVPAVTLDDEHEIQPDIAYDPRNGNLWLVYSYNKASGLWDIYSVFGLRYSGYVLWASPQVSHEQAKNGFHPRIAIGLLHMGATPGQYWILGMGYTTGTPPPAVDDRWHIRIAWWKLDLPILVINDFPIGCGDENFREFPSGLPMVDIGPPGTNHAAVVCTQAKSNEWSDTTVCYWDHKGAHMDICTDSGWGVNSATFPAVAIHEYTDDPEDHWFASVSYLRTDNYVSGYWEPMVAQIDTFFPGGDLGEAELGDEEDILDLINGPYFYGEWDPGMLIEHNVGMSSGMSILSNSSYWSVWSGYETGGGPNSVYGAHGYTEF